MLYDEYCLKDQIKTVCMNVFEVGKYYSKKEVKSMLQQIYYQSGLYQKIAKATDLSQYVNCREVQRIDGQGKRVWYIEIL